MPEYGRSSFVRNPQFLKQHRKLRSMHVAVQPASLYMRSWEAELDDVNVRQFVATHEFRPCLEYPGNGTLGKFVFGHSECFG